VIARRAGWVAWRGNQVEPVCPAAMGSDAERALSYYGSLRYAQDGGIAADLRVTERTVQELEDLAVVEAFLLPVSAYDLGELIGALSQRANSMLTSKWSATASSVLLYAAARRAAAAGRSSSTESSAGIDSAVRAAVAGAGLLQFPSTPGRAP
jgi:hypothetical protein